MFIARVKSNIVATVKHPAYLGQKIFAVHPIHPVSREEQNETILAVDFVDAGIGDIVIVSQEGGSARRILDNIKAPVRSFIVAIVDNWTIEEK